MPSYNMVPQPQELKYAASERNLERDNYIYDIIT